MNFAILSTYPPRECGIASFSKDLRENIELWGACAGIIAISDREDKYDYKREVVFEINEKNRDDYIIAAQFINTADIDAVFIEHEYGIFGGKDGEYVLDFIRNLEKPFILNTHTVLREPSENQLRVLSELGGKSLAVICMTNRSAELLQEIYQIPRVKMYIIPHGVPIFKERPREDIKREYGIEGKNLVTTFGFIVPGKGLELGIKAISFLKDKYPDIIYLIAGETHPKLKESMGESYRDSLLDLLESLKMQEHVKFINRYVSLKELGEILYMTDIYLTPYPNRSQAVSGTLSYAIGCGRAIVSTPYDFSQEVLSQGRGLISSNADPEELAKLIDKVLSDTKLKNQLEYNSRKLGKTMIWPQVGKKYVDIMSKILSNRERKVL